MANRFFNQFGKTLEKEIVKLFGKVSFAAAGAPTLSASDSFGIKSITRTGAGAYDIVLGTSGANANVDVYNKFKNLTFTFLNATAPAAPLMYVVSQSVATPTTGKISVQFTDKAQAATDPGNGEVLFFEVTLKNSSAV